MKKNLLLFMVCLMSVSLSAKESWDSFEQETSGENSNALFENVTLTAPDMGYEVERKYGKKERQQVISVDSITGDFYYKSWLGEKCLYFGENSKTYYTWKRDVTYAGIPIFLSSFLIKSQKRAFRSARFAMDENWKSEIDNYTQFVPYVPVLALKAFGYQGRSSWDRLMVSALASNAVMAVAVNATKYSVKEMRPDNSTENSFPSGHTATAFVAATVLHKEYGLTRSPWFSVGGYAIATGTGLMRVLNNRHWISDVIAGAGIGILSTELGYFIGDVIYRNNGITRRELTQFTNPNHPSFFDIQMGIGMHSKSIDFTFNEEVEPSKLHLGTSSMVGVEGAYFFNKYVGVGGVARVTTTPTSGWGLDAEDRENLNESAKILEQAGYPGLYHVSMSNNNFVNGSFDAGVYLNLPISKHFSVGAKFLAGVRTASGVEFKGQLGYRQAAVDSEGNRLYTVGLSGTPNVGDNGVISYEPSTLKYEPVWMFDDGKGGTFNSNEMLQPGVETAYNFHLISDDPEKPMSKEYAVSKVTGKSSFNFMCGLSFTYRYRNNFAWKIFIDYDAAKTDYTYRMDLYGGDHEYVKGMKKTMTPEQSALFDEMIDMGRMEGKASKYLNFFTLGGAFSICF